MTINIDKFLSNLEHDAVNHKASPFSLLDENAHDMLNHTGLMGVSGAVLINFQGSQQVQSSTGGYVTMHTYTLPAAELGTNEAIEIEVAGRIGMGLGGTGDIRLHFGGSAIVLLSASELTSDFHIKSLIFHRGATNQTAHSTKILGATVQQSLNGTAETVSGTIVIKTDAQISVSGGGRNVVVAMLKVTKLA